LAQIGPVDFGIIGLTEIVKNKKQQQNIWPAELLLRSSRACKIIEIYRVAQNKIPHWRICNISATNGLILKKF